MSLSFIGAKATMKLPPAIDNIAYALSKKTLYHYVSLMNESENKSGTSAYILLPGILDTAFKWEAMPDADFTERTKPADIALCIRQIVKRVLSEPVIEL